MSSIGVSVIIPTLNRGGYLFDSMKDVLDQNYPRYELIVIDQSSEIDPAIAQLIKNNCDRIRYEKVDFKGLPQARNYGWQIAQYDIVLYIDDDVRLPQGFINNHAISYNNEAIAVVGGRVIETGMDVGPSIGRFNPWFFNLKRGFQSTEKKLVAHVKGCNFSCRKRCIMDCGGFDEQLNVGAALYEELEFMLRVRSKGYTVFFNGDAGLEHLVADVGGCRVIGDIPKYMYSLVHNRTLIAARHLKWYHLPTVLVRLLLLVASYSKKARSITPVLVSLKAIIVGFKTGSRDPKCSLITE